LAKKRIYEAAREYKISSEALVNILRELGFAVKSHMSTITPEMNTAVEQKFAREREEVKKEIEIKRRKLEERKATEALRAKPKVVKKRAKKREVVPEKKAKPEEPKRRIRKPVRKEIDKVAYKKEVEESFKKTISQMEGAKRPRRRRGREAAEVEEEAAERVIKVTEYMPVAELAQAMGIKPAKVIAKCMELGVMATINQRLDLDTISTVALEFGFNIEEEKEVGLAEEIYEEPERLKPRSPVVTIMGHVDHGKTSLLDYIRKSTIIAGEHGGITQHIGAYEVETKAGSKITFIDTPGHAAFTAMRSRGVQVTDIVVLIVAADDGIMPQTVEAIDHARAAAVPMIVAINKMDLPDADSESVKTQLAKHNLAPEEWGGKTIVVEISAKTGSGVDHLLEMILLQAEVLELKADPGASASGVVIESRMDRGRGPVATVLVQKGTLGIGDPYVSGDFCGRVRAMFNERNQPLTIAGPSAPTLVLGFSGLPLAGDTFKVVQSESEAREISLKRQRLRREKESRLPAGLTLSQVYEQIKEGQMKELRLIIKGDVDGSAEALSDTLQRISSQEVRLNIIHRGVGAVNESDVLLASASQAVIIGFHVRPDSRARQLAEQEKVDVRLYDVIYEAEADIKKALEGMLEPELREVPSGTAEVRNIFRISRVGQVAGCYVRGGVVRRGSRARVIRNGEMVHDGVVTSLKRFKDDVKEVSAGFECGIGIEQFDDLKVGDEIQAYEIEKHARSIDSGISIGT
jgi:translation initiation factor IF-2